MTGDVIVKGMRVAGKTSMSPESSEFTPPGANYIITAIFPLKEKNLENKLASVDFSGFRQTALAPEAQLCQMEEHSSSYSPPRAPHLDHSPRMSKRQMLANIRPEAPYVWSDVIFTIRCEEPGAAVSSGY